MTRLAPEPFYVWKLLIGRSLQYKYVWLVAFFAGFCSVANGAYLGAGAWFPAGDSADLIQHGAARWQLALFGLSTTVLGFYFWSGLGRYFGLGADASPVDRKAAIGMAVTMVSVAVVEWLVSG